MSIISSYESFKEIFEHKITVRYIAERLSTVHANAPVEEAIRKMNEQGYDVLGIEREGVITGYIPLDKLTKGLCGDFEKSFLVAEVISESTPLIELFKIFKDKQRAFVLENNEIKYIVTLADLQKQPVRALLFGIISLLEMQLLHTIKLFFPNESWKELLSEGRLNKTINLYEERNEAIHLIDCLELCDKTQLVLSHNDIFKGLGFASNKSAKRAMNQIIKLRNKIAHSQELIKGGLWPKVIESVTVCEKLLHNLTSLNP